jgi:threo-3-hydroxy-L-aspartate ammonia-lyase
MLNPVVVPEAAERIKGLVYVTPLLSSSILNELLGNTILFKCEGFQKTGSFKARGAFNALVKARESSSAKGTRVCAFSSGNHSQALALAAKQNGIVADIFIPFNASAIKIAATRAYGANVIITETRLEAETRVAECAQSGQLVIHPFDNDLVLAGQGTACLEALTEASPDAVFAPCGGGGLLAGTLLARNLSKSRAEVFGVEPTLASDAQSSYQQGSIVGLPSPTTTIADGVRTPRIAERTFEYIKQLDGMLDVSEADIIYWSQWLSHLLKISVEPTSAVAMAGALQWIRSTGSRGKQVLIILSGGNIDPTSQKLIWEESYLDRLPNLEGSYVK